MSKHGRSKARAPAVWVEMPSPFSVEPGQIRLRAPAGGFTREHLDRLRNGSLGQPFILEREDSRVLFFTADAVQSAMSTGDPNELLCTYTRKMMSFLLLVPEPQHVLMIGLGGGSIAKFCLHHLPRTRFTAVEIDAEVIAMRREFAIPDDDERFEVVHDDGAGFLALTTLRPDVVLVDAFDEIGVAPSLASLEFHLSVSRVLRPGGLMIMNLSGYRSRYAIHVSSARTAFAGGTLLVPVEGEGNLLLFGFPSPPDLPPLAQLEARAARLSSEMPIDFRRYLRRIRASKYVGDGPHPLLGGPAPTEAADRVSQSSSPP